MTDWLEKESAIRDDNLMEIEEERTVVIKILGMG